MNARFSPTVLASIILAACGLVLFTTGCRSDGPGEKDELAGVTQFVVNGSFEEPDGQLPKGWRTRSWQRDGDAAFDVESSGRTGGRSVSISSAKGADASWVATVPIRPYSRYRLSGWIKTENVVAGSGRGAQININGREDWRTAPLAGTLDWSRVDVEFEAGANDAVEVTCLFGGWGRSTGKAWFDDIELVRLSGKDLGTPKVTIDGGKTGKPMSKYIYGQFIEHLGRCIYQGIWAEMLEDRKFFWPVGEGESPWRSVGGAGLVKMDKVKPFTGGHTPRDHAPRARDAGRDRAGGAWPSSKGRNTWAGSSWPGTPAPRRSPSASSGATARTPARPSRSRRSGRDYRTFPFTFKAGASTENARLEIVVVGPAARSRSGRSRSCRRTMSKASGPRSWRSSRSSMRPVYRWPGGNFVSGYDWRDGIGDRDRRPPRKNPAWTGVEHNDVGIHEYMDLMRLIGSEPYITVNSGLGDVAMALEELQYANGAADTKMGKLRAVNGHPEPWGVKFWAIGNEMYGDWQLGHMPLSDYVKKHTQYAVAMKAMDPSVQVVAVGAVGRWSETMLAEASNHMDLISEHFYVQHEPGLLGPRQPDADGDPAHRRGPPEVPGRDPVAQSEGGPGRPRRVELLVRAARLRRARHAVLPRGRPRRRRRVSTSTPARATSTSWPTTPRRSTSSGPSRLRRRRPSSTRPASSWPSTASTSGRSRSRSAARPSRSTSWPAGRTRRRRS